MSLTAPSLTPHPHPSPPPPKTNRYFLKSGKEGQEKLKSKLDSDMDDYFKAAKARGLKEAAEGGEEEAAAAREAAAAEGDA